MDNITEDDLEKRLTSRGLFFYAQDFFKTFEEVYDRHQKITERLGIKYFLLCHALELALKAFLRNKKLTLKQLQTIGHDLEKLLRICQKHGFYFDTESTQQITTLSMYYKTKQFEYPQTGYISLPHLESIGLIIRLILKKVEEEINK